MTSEPEFRRTSGVVSASVDGDVVLMAPTDGRCYALRGSAEAVWDLLDEDRTVGEIVEVLVGRFDIDALRCTQDVSLLLADMVGAGVVERDAGTGG